MARHRRDFRASDPRALRYVRVLRAPIERVWGAIASADELSIWLHPVTRIELRLGGRVWFAPESRLLGPQIGKVTALEPPRLLRLERPPARLGSPGSLQLELAAVDAGTQLSFIATGAFSTSDAESDSALGAGPAQHPPGSPGGLDCMGELFAVQRPSLLPLGITRERQLELLAVYYDHIWQVCAAEEYDA